MISFPPPTRGVAWFSCGTLKSDVTPDCVSTRYDELAEFLQKRIKVELQYGKDLAVLGKQVKQCYDTGYVLLLVLRACATG